MKRKKRTATITPEIALAAQKMADAFATRLADELVDDIAEAMADPSKLMHHRIALRIGDPADARVALLITGLVEVGPPEFVPDPPEMGEKKGESS